MINFSLKSLHPSDQSLNMSTYLLACNVCRLSSLQRARRSVEDEAEEEERELLNRLDQPAYEYPAWARVNYKALLSNTR